MTGEVQYTEEMPVKVPWSLPASRPVFEGDEAPVLLSSDPDHPVVKARLAAGDRLIAAPDRQPGERLVDAVAMMDKLRTNGPWESEQTHETLRRYLLEETYEVFDAVHSGNADELREELGDVLLQVLFHARIAEDAPQHPFSIDDVADSLVRKLGNRVPAVLAGESISLDEQLAQWEERKALEKRGKAHISSMDDVPTGQPALALAQKVIERVTARAACRSDPGANDVGERVGTCRRRERVADSGSGFHGHGAQNRACDRGGSPRRGCAGGTRRGHARGDHRGGVAGVLAKDARSIPRDRTAPDRIPEPSPEEVPEPSPVEVPEPSPTEVPEPSPTGPQEPSPEECPPKKHSRTVMNRKIRKQRRS